jgi:hypothetical protein
VTTSAKTTKKTAVQPPSGMTDMELAISYVNFVNKHNLYPVPASVNKVSLKLGLAASVGSLARHVERLIREKSFARQAQVDNLWATHEELGIVEEWTDRVVDECGDALWYLVRLVSSFMLDGSQVMIDCVEKYLTHDSALATNAYPVAFPHYITSLIEAATGLFRQPDAASHTVESLMKIAVAACPDKPASSKALVRMIETNMAKIQARLDGQK